MKLILSLFTILSVSAHASYYRYVCSSADAEIRWEDSHGDNTIYFTYYDFESNQEKKLSLDFHSVNIKFLSKKTIKKSHSNDGCMAWSDHHYHGKVRITPSAEVSEQFKKAFKEGKAEDYVICHDHISGETGGDNCR